MWEKERITTVPNKAATQFCAALEGKGLKIINMGIFPNKTLASYRT
jgi:hypothetical protein